MTERGSTGGPTSATNLSLHLLVLRCQLGDERAFGQLMEQFGAKTMRYLRGLVGESADDVQQEVWLTVYRSVASLANPRAFRTWLYRITRHRAVDFLRREQRERELIVDVPEETIAAAVSTDDLEITDDNKRDEMWQAIDKLAPAHREVLLLRYRDEMSYAAIALVMECSIGTVRSRLHYAKQQVMQVIE
jgi:RNA polymerase sigma-70 factor (ECF subfamily)